MKKNNNNQIKNNKNNASNNNESLKIDIEDKEILEEEIHKLKSEIESFKKERERIRNIVGKIGGVPTLEAKLLNIAFILGVIIPLILTFFVGDKYSVFMIDIAIGVLSLKLIYLIHQLTRVNHFELWILTSLEWRMNEIVNEVREVFDIIKKEK